MTCRPVPRAVVHGIAIALCLATVVNGASFWLKRTGMVDSPRYERYVAHKSALQITGRSDPAWPEVRRFHSEELVRLYSVNRVQTMAKATKYAVIAGLIGICVWTWWRSGDRRQPWKQPLLLLFASLVLIAGLQSWRHFGSIFLVPALRTVGFLAMLFTAARLASTKNLGLISNYLIVLLLFQLVVLPLELAWGLDIYTGGAFAWLPGDRAVGVFLQPASLGLFSVVALSAFLCFGTAAATSKLAAVCIAAVVVSASGSASAMLLWALVAGDAFLAKAGLCGRTRIALLLLLAGVVVGASPWLTGRPDVMASVWGRMEKMQSVLEGARSLDAVLFGQGLGAGSNAAFHWVRHAAGAGTPVPALAPYAGSDSTPQTLLLQTGVVGCLTFYALLGQCAIRDRRARPLLGILTLASLFTSLVEFFPVDVLLAWLLARGAVRRDRVSQCVVAGGAGEAAPAVRNVRPPGGY